MQKTEIFFEGLRKEIERWSRVVADSVSGRRDLSWTSEKASYQVLRRLLTSDEAVSALECITYDVCCSLVHSILLMLDGATWVADHLHMALIDAETGQDLSPPEGTYHGEFAMYVTGREQECQDS